MGGAFEQFGVPKGHTGPAEEMYEAVNAGWMDLGITGAEHIADTTSHAMCLRLLTRPSRRKRLEPVPRGQPADRRNRRPGHGDDAQRSAPSGLRQRPWGSGTAVAHGGFVFDGCSCLCREKQSNSVVEICWRPADLEANPWVGFSEVMNEKGSVGRLRSSDGGLFGSGVAAGYECREIHAGTKLALADMSGRGWLAESCFINPDDTAATTVEHCLASHRYDCVVIGAGVRLPPSRLGVFEAVVNAIHRAAPQRPSPSTHALTTAARQPRAGFDMRFRRALMGSGRPAAASFALSDRQREF